MTKVKFKYFLIKSDGLHLDLSYGNTIIRIKMEREGSPPIAEVEGCRSGKW